MSHYPTPIDVRSDDRSVRTPLDSAALATLSGQGALDGDLPPSEINPTLLDADALKVLRHLRRNGHQAYLVGGCVRDLLLGRRPKDFDVATSANPEEVRATFRNCRLIGRRFRLAHVYFKGQKIIEVSTFRKNPVEEVLAEDPSAEAGDLLISEDNVFGTDEEDARRRDFTVNGLFYDVGLGEVIDYVNGRIDLETRTMRTIGTPEIRLREDPVRLLRAIRFAAKLDFQIEKETWGAMQRQVGELARCAPARVLEETLRLLRSGASRRAVELLREVGALPILLPSVALFLERASEDEAGKLLGVLGAMDERILAGLPTDDSLLLAALLLRIVRLDTGGKGDAPIAEDNGGPSPLAAIEPVLAELTRTARLPRRIAEGARLLLLSQSALLGERRRRGSPTRFMRSPHFGDALVLMAANVKASGEGAAALERWKQRDAELNASQPRSEPVVAATQDAATGFPPGAKGGRDRQVSASGRRPGAELDGRSAMPAPASETALHRASAPGDVRNAEAFSFESSGLL